MTATRRPRRLARVLTGAALAVGAVLGAAAAPAAAHDPAPTATVSYRDTGDCPCSGGDLADPFGGTYFGHDEGGYGVKIALTRGGSYLGKVEFHPAGQQLRVYDTSADDSTFYVHVSATAGGVTRDLGTYSAPGGDFPVRSVAKGFDLPEGTSVDLAVYEDAELTDYVGGARGTGAAIA